MNCLELQNTLDELLGCGTLPEQIELHLQECDGCRKFWDELRSLSDSLDSGNQFYPTTDELERMVGFVEASIEVWTPRRSIWFTGRLSSIATAAVLILTASAVSFQWGRYEHSRESTAPTYSYEIIVDSEIPEEFALDDETVATIIEDYISEEGPSAGDQLLDDLTEEEYNYLLETMDIGDIL